MSRLQLAVEQIVFARMYTHRLLDSLEPDDWFRMPAGCASHVGWQVGHLAMAQYRLGLVRLRGQRDDDANLLSDHLLKLFGKDSVPARDASLYPAVESLRASFELVHAKLLDELQIVKDEDLDQPVLKPHPLVKTKLESLRWCAHHEGVHAGQIGLLRRMLGYEPIW